MDKASGGEAGLGRVRELFFETLGWAKDGSGAHVFVPRFELAGDRHPRATSALGDPEDFATIAGYFASDGSKYHSGDSIVIDDASTVFQ